jgi:hypothetical protein
MFSSIRLTKVTPAVAFLPHHGEHICTEIIKVVVVIMYVFKRVLQSVNYKIKIGN